MRLRRWAPAALVALATLLSAGASWNDSATTDEPYHVLAAWSHVVEGLGDLNPDKPPLTKLVAGLALAPLRLAGTERPPVARLTALPEETRRFLYANRVSAETILHAARLPQALFLIVLLWGVHAWAKELWGEEAGLLAVAAVGLQPLVLGHATLVHTDVAAAATWAWSLLWLHRWLGGRRHAWIGFGLCLGLSLLAKFSGLTLALFALLLVLVDALRSKERRRALLFAPAAGLALLVVLAGYGPALRNMTVPLEDETIGVQAAQWPGTASSAAALRRLARLSMPIAHYGLGLLHLAETNREGQGVNYLFGRTSVTGFWWYFPAAFVLKVSLPFLALLAACVALKRADWTRDDLFLLLPVGLYFLAALGATYNIGARHLLPVLPSLAVFGSQVARRGSTGLSRGLIAAFLLSAALSFPHYISHFSLVCGGSSRGSRYLNDSNLDWGQDWARLARAAEGKAWQPLTYVYIGTGFPGHHLRGAHDYLNEGIPPRPGFYAVGSFTETVGPPYLRLLGHANAAARLELLLGALHRAGRDAGGAGTSIRVYRLD